MQTLADCNRIGALSDTGSAGYRRGMVINARKNKLLEQRLRSQLRERSALGSSPRGWRCAVLPPEQTDEMRDVRVADLFRDDIHALIRVKQTTSRFRHSPRDDPGDGASTRRPSQGRRDVRGRATHG